MHPVLTTREQVEGAYTNYLAALNMQCLYTLLQYWWPLKSHFAAVVAAVTY